MDLPWRRRRRSWAGLTDAVGRIAERHLLTPSETARLDRSARWLLTHVTFEGAREFELTDRMCATISAQAALLVLGLDPKVLSHVSTVVVHPTTMVLTGPHRTPIPHVVADGSTRVTGHTAAHDPVFLAWDAIAADLADPEGRRNVVLHEFAHQLDLLDGVVDGTPPLASAASRDEWVRVCTAHLNAIRAGADPQPLRPYAGTNPGEFFAVATETFFCAPGELANTKPDLYDVLRSYYRQDPAARAAGS